MNRIISQEKIFEEKTLWQDKEYFCEYIDSQDFSKIKPITQVQALCFLPTGEFVIFEDKNRKYGLPGGTVEKGETLDEALFRELREEAAVKPIKYGPLLYLRIVNLSEDSVKITYQVRYWALVDLLNEAVSDPDGKAIRRLLVNEEDLIKRLNWGKKLEVYLAQLKKMRKDPKTIIEKL